MITNKPRASTLLIALTMLSTSFSLWAQTTHNVTVGDNFFSPSELTIEVGDTVQWNNASGGAPHDVVADDGSFASAINTVFMFSQTFTSVGEVPYHCSVHSSPGGTAMNGNISVMASSNTFTINPGLNDSWWNPVTPGQGFFITVFPNSTEIFLAWFTYDTVRPDSSVTANLGEPGHRWLTAFGEYSGGSAALDIELTQGGVFDSPTPMVQQTNDGTAIVDFFGCNEGMITYNIPSANVQGIIPIERIATDNVAGCEDLAAQ